MNRKEIILLLTGTFFLLMIIFAIVFEFLGFIPFIFSNELIDYIGVFLIISVLSFAFLTFSLFEGREDRINKKLRVLIKSVCVVFSVIFVFIGVVLTSFMHEKLVKRSVSPDKKYELYIVEDNTFGGLDATVYKRLFASVKSYVNSDFLNNSDADLNVEINVKWEDDCCKLTYDHPTDYETEETETLAVLYFDD